MRWRHPDAGAECLSWYCRVFSLGRQASYRWRVGSRTEARAGRFPLPAIEDAACSQSHGPSNRCCRLRGVSSIAGVGVFGRMRGWSWAVRGRSVGRASVVVEWEMDYSGPEARFSSNAGAVASPRRAWHGPCAAPCEYHTARRWLLRQIATVAVCFARLHTVYILTTHAPFCQLASSLLRVLPHSASCGLVAVRGSPRPPRHPLRLTSPPE